MFELIHTSTQQGLIAGRSGFATVAMTEGMPANLITPVENLSGYKPLFPPNHPDAAGNPVIYSYQRSQYGSMVLHVVSRIGAAGLDHTGRSNKIAHHLVFTRENEFDAIPHGAVSVARDRANFVTEWDKPAELLAVRHPGISAKELSTADTWARYTGDAGWAGVVAEKFRENPEISFNLEFCIGTPAEDLLEMIAEVVMLLKHEEAAQFTFTTYFIKGSVGDAIFFRAMAEGAPQVAAIRRLKPESLLSVCRGGHGPVPAEYEDSPLVAAARTGRFVQPVVQPVELTVEPEVFREIPLAKPRAKVDTPPAESPVAHEPEPEVVVVADAEHEPEHESWKRLVMFSVGVVLIVSVLASAFFLIDRQQREVVVQVAPKIEEVHPVELPEPPVEKPQEIPAVLVSLTPPEKPVESVVQPAIRALNVSEKFKFFLDWQSGEKRIPLPESLKDATEVSVEIGRIGRIEQLSSNISNYIRKSGNGVVILPALESKPKMFEVVYAPLTDAPGLEMKIGLEQGRLVIQLPRESAVPPRHGPGIGNIRNFIFRDAAGHEVRYMPAFEKDFVSHLGKGGKISREEENDWIVYYFLPEWDVRLMWKNLSVKIGGRTVSGGEGGEKVKFASFKKSLVSDIFQLRDEYARLEKQVKNVSSKVTDTIAKRQSLLADPPKVPSYEEHLSRDDKKLLLVLGEGKDLRNPVVQYENARKLLENFRKAHGLDSVVPTAVSTFNKELQKYVNELSVFVLYQQEISVFEQQKTRMVKLSNEIKTAENNLIATIDNLQPGLAAASRLTEFIRSGKAIDVNELAESLIFLFKIEIAAAESGKEASL